MSENIGLHYNIRNGFKTPVILTSRTSNVAVESAVACQAALRSNFNVKFSLGITRPAP